MKFTQAPKKMLLTGLSAAMVVAFAPNLALAKVDNTSGSTTEQEQAGTTVATLTYKSGKTTTTAPYTSNAAETDDDAVQAALTAAAQASQDGKTDITVALSKDVTVANVTGTQDNSGKYWYPADAANTGLVAGGNVTIDLGGHTLSTRAAGADVYATPVLTLGKDKDVQQPAGRRNVSVYIQDGKLTGSGSSWSLERAAEAWDAGGNNLGATLTNISSAESDGEDYIATGDATNRKFKVASGNYNKNDSWHLYNITMTTTTPTLPTGNQVSKLTAGKVTVQNGTLANSTTVANAASNSGQAVVDADAGELVLGKGAKVVSTASERAIDAQSANVSLQGDASVTATAAKGDLTAINVEGGTATIEQTDADKRANASKYAAGPTVSAELTAADTGNVAKGIAAEKVAAYTTGTVTAKATGAGATAGRTGYMTIDPVTGAINPAPTTQGTPGNVPGNTFAVFADNADLGYGNYTGDYAVDADAGEIRYGSYAGLVNGNLSLRGGKFSYDVTKEQKDKDGNVTAQKNDLDQGQKDAVGKDIKRAISQEGTTWYVYRVGVADKDAWFESADNAVQGRKMVDVNVPDGAKKANGQAYSGLGEYVQEKFLDPASKKLVVAQKGQPGDLGTELNDGNTDNNGGLNVTVSGRYYASIDQQARKANADAWLAFDNEALDSNRAEQALYTTSAAEYYGYQKNAQGNLVPKVYAANASLDGTSVKVTAGAVTANAKATVYRLDGGKLAEVPSAEAPNVGSNITSLSWNTDQLGVFGVLHDTTETAKAQQAKNIALKAKTLAATAITKDNVDDIAQQVSTLDALYSILDEDMKKSYAPDVVKDLATARANISAFRASQNAAKKANTLKATASKKTVKYSTVKKKAVKVTLKASKAKGKVTYKRAKTTGAYKKVSVTSKGKVTFKKGAKKGTYKFKVRAAGNSSYKAKTVTVSVKVK